MNSDITKIEVHWSPEWESWGVFGYDAEGNQVDDGRWEPYFDDAWVLARQWMRSTDTVHTARAYTRDDRLKFSIRRADL